MDPQIRFRLATRIHFALLRQFGEDVGVSALLTGSHEAREALWVCEASGNAELTGLARDFQRSVGTPVSQETADAPQDAAWARNTSGFGASALPTLEPELPERASAPRRLLKPSSWRR
jgi:hypothetical protein